MEPIRPIGPRELDVEPVLRVQPGGREGEREQPQPRKRREPPREQPEQPPEDGGSLIDVRV